MGKFIPLKVLYVEDNEGDAYIFQKMLKGMYSNIDITRVNCVKDSLEVLEAEDFDILLVDLSLTDVSGVDVIKVIRSLDPVTPILVLTGFDDPKLARQLIFEGAHSYLTKNNIDKNMLHNSISSAVSPKINPPILYS